MPGGGLRGQKRRFELALEVQRWTRARSECLPVGGQNYSYATRTATTSRLSDVAA